jgi:hypothetical protein
VQDVRLDLEEILAVAGRMTAFWQSSPEFLDRSTDSQIDRTRNSVFSPSLRRSTVRRVPGWRARGNARRAR